MGQSASFIVCEGTCLEECPKMNRTIILFLLVVVVALADARRHRRRRGMRNLDDFYDPDDDDYSHDYDYDEEWRRPMRKGGRYRSLRDSDAVKDNPWGGVYKNPMTQKGNGGVYTPAWIDPDTCKPPECVFQ